MNATDEATGQDVDVQLKDVVDRIAKGIPFTREEQDRAAAEIDRMREENARRFGIQDVTLDIIREMRSR